MKHIAAFAFASSLLGAAAQANTVTILDLQANVSLGQASLQARPGQSRIELETDSPGLTGDAFTDRETGEIGVQIDAAAGANQTVELAGGGAFLFLVDVAPGTVFPAGFFELTITGTLLQDIGPAPISTYQTQIDALIGISLTNSPGGDQIKAVSAGVLGVESGTGAPVFGGGFDLLVGDAPTSLAQDGTFLSVLSSKEFSFVDLSTPTFPGFPKQVSIGFDIGTSVFNGASSSALFMNTATFRINDTLGLDVAGAPATILVSNAQEPSTPVPLPATAWLLLLGSLSLYGTSRRGKRTPP